MLGCKLHNQMHFLASGGGTCPQRAVLGLFILASETGFSLVAGQRLFILLQKSDVSSCCTWSVLARKHVLALSVLRRRRAV